MSTPATIPLNELRHDFEAPPSSGITTTRTARGSVDELIASITAMGLIVPLTIQVYEGVAYVVGGNQRLRALRAIHGPDSAWRAKVTDSSDLNAQPKEVALAENVIRAPLHPVDAYEAFAELVSKGVEAADIAKRFGITLHYVKQSLAIAQLAAPIRELWRSGKISAATAEAFTLETDQKRQLAVLRRVEKQEGDVRDWAVRRELIGDGRAGGKMIAFVGAEAYEAAGGKVMRDLFKGNHGVSDQALLARLAEEKLAAACVGLVTEGWKFAVHGKEAEGHYAWNREHRDGKLTKDEAALVKDLTKRSTELGEKIDGDDRIDDDDNDALADLEAQIEGIQTTGKMRAYTPQDRAKLGCVVSIGNDGKLEVSPGWKMPAAKAAKVAAKEAGGLTAADRKKVAANRVKAAAKGQVSKALEVDLTIAKRRAVKRALAGWGAANAVTAGGATAGVSRLPALLAALVAKLIKPEDNWHREIDEKMIDAMFEVLPADLVNEACLSVFDAPDYFQRSPAPFATVALSEIAKHHGPVPTPEKTKDLKALAAAEATRTGWLPVHLRTVHYPGPVLTPEKTPAKVKGAAKAKRKAAK